MQQDQYSRLRCLEARLDRVKSLWGNEKAYSSIVATGRYIKLCGVTGKMTEAIDQATAAEDSQNLRAAEK